MNKLIYILGKQYESLVDKIQESDDDAILRTRDGRFFSFNLESIALLKRIEAGLIQKEENTNAELFIKNVLLTKGIYCNKGELTKFVKKKPTLSYHLTVAKAALVNKITRYFHFLLSPLVAIPILLIAVILNVTFFYQNNHLFSYEFIFRYTPFDLVLLYPIVLICSFFHEIGHATACKKYSGDTGEIGIGINFIFPVFFANVSNIYLLSRKEKIFVALSGVYFQFIFGSIVMLIALNHPELNKFLILNIIGIITNLIPYFRNDGYWILNDALRKKDLLKETIYKLNTRKRLNLSNIIYGLFFISFSIVIALIMLNFIFYRGPDIASDIFILGVFDFSTTLMLVIITSYYIASIFAFIKVIGFSISMINNNYKTNKLKVN